MTLSNAVTQPVSAQNEAPFFQDDFEADNFTSNWTIEINGNEQDYYWGLSDNRSSSSSYSAYCAGSVPGASMYAQYMEVIMYREVDLSSYALADLSFSYWLDCADGADYFGYAGYYNESGWQWENWVTGDSGGWVAVTGLNIPTTATRIGFYFSSDEIKTDDEGAYVDDISLTCTRFIPCEEPNGEIVVGIDVYPADKLDCCCPGSFRDWAASL